MEPESTPAQDQNMPQNHPHVHTHTWRRQVLIPLFIFLFLIAGTTVAVLYGKGYRLFLQQDQPKILGKTGILRTTSLPPGAQVYVDGHLTTATDNSINLPPKKYTITIAKDGYWDWQKDFEIRQEVVQNADALLFPKAPTLQSISTFGIESVTVDPTRSKLAFKIASNNAKRNGVYVFDMTARSIPVLAGQSNSTQVANDAVDVFSKANLTWSPDGKQLLASTSGVLNKPTYYLLRADKLNDEPENVTATLQAVLDTWEEQKRDKELAQFKSLKPAVQKFAKTNFKIISWSPDDNKILYQASESGQLPVFLKPRLIGNNHLYERRDLQKGSIYVYNIKEDINTRIVEKEEKVDAFTWFPDSKHILYVKNKKITVIEDDGSNMTSVYGGPFIGNYVYPWPDGSKLVIVTNLNNPGASPTLYTVGLK